MLKECDLTGKVAIVTGAAKGIGKGIALTLADAGADIVAADVDSEGLKSLSDDINSMGQRCLAITTDVTDEAQVHKMVDEATSKLGQIDILVNNAGKGNRRAVVPLEDQNIKPMTDEDWESVMNLNVKAILHCVRAAGPQMIERRGYPFHQPAAVIERRLRPCAGKIRPAGDIRSNDYRPHSTLGLLIHDKRLRYY